MNNLEQNLCTSVAMYPERACLAIDLVRDEDLCEPHAIVAWEAICAIVADGGTPTTDALGSRLVGAGRLEAAAWAVTGECASTLEGLESLCRSIAAEGLVRRVRAAAAQIQAAGAAVEDACAYAASSLQAITAATDRAAATSHTIAVGLPQIVDDVCLGRRAHSIGTGIFSPTGRELQLYQEYTLLAAMGGVGKSTLALNLIAHAARNKHRCYYLSLQDPRFVIQERLLALLSGLPHFRIRERKLDSKAAQEALRGAMVELAQLPIVVDLRPGIDVSELRLAVQSAVSRHGADLVVVDYLSKITDRRSRGNEMLEHKRAGEALDSLAGLLQIPVLGLHHLRKSSPGAAKARPTQSDLRYGGDNEARCVWVLFREDEEVKEKMTLSVVKNNNGPCGDIDLRCDLSRCKIESANAALWSENDY